MIKHYVNLFDNIYYIEKDNVIMMSIELDKNTNQVIIRTPNSVYNGTVEDLEVFSKSDSMEVDYEHFNNM